MMQFYTLEEHQGAIPVNIGIDAYCEYIREDIVELLEDRIDA